MVKVCTDKWYVKPNGMKLKTPGYYLDNNLATNFDNYVIKPLKLAIDRVFSQYFQFVLKQMQDRGMLTHVKIQAAQAGSQFEE